MNSYARSDFTIKDSNAIKGIAILMMIFHHCFYDPIRFAGYDISFAPFSQNIVVAVCNMFKICVPLFAFISGYGLYQSACSHPSPLRWIRTRLCKTLSGFWFVYILVFILMQLYGGYPQKIYFQDGAVNGMFYVLFDFFGISHLLNTPSMLTTWWYIGAAIIYIVILPLYIKLINKFGVLDTFLILIALPRLSGIGYPGGVSPYTFLTAFLLGTVFSRINFFQKWNSISLHKNSICNTLLMTLLTGVLFIAGTILFAILPVEKFWEFKYGLYPVFLICVLWKYVIHIPILYPVLSFFGKHSMNIFLIHNFIRRIFFPDFIYGCRHFILIGAVLFLTSLCISVFVIEPLKRTTKYNLLMQKFF